MCPEALFSWKSRWVLKAPQYLPPIIPRDFPSQFLGIWELTVKFTISLQAGQATKSTQELPELCVLLCVPTVKWGHLPCEWSQSSHLTEGPNDMGEECFAFQPLQKFPSGDCSFLDSFNKSIQTLAEVSSGLTSWLQPHFGGLREGSRLVHMVELLAPGNTAS